jgi:hypothetical protein
MLIRNGVQQKLVPVARYQNGSGCDDMSQNVSNAAECDMLMLKRRSLVLLNFTQHDTRRL